MEKKFDPKDLNDAREFLLERDGGKNAKLAWDATAYYEKWLDKTKVAELCEESNTRQFAENLIAYADETGRETYADRCKLREAVEHVFCKELERASEDARRRRCRQAKPWDEMSEEEKKSIDDYEEDLGAFGVHKRERVNKIFAVCAEKYHDKTILSATDAYCLVEEIKTARKKINCGEAPDDHGMSFLGWAIARHTPDEKCKIVLEYDPDRKESCYLIAMK